LTISRVYYPPLLIISIRRILFINIYNTINTIINHGSLIQNGIRNSLVGKVSLQGG
jgi:hypothetical protein